MLISKIQAQHRQKMAYVYLRQSTMAQVYHHQESTQRQYALKDRALELGWMPDQIRVLDADLGLSGTQGNNRLDFQTLVADVSLEKVGAVFALEVSRLSRSCSDWHRLLEICSLTGTLIVDKCEAIKNVKQPMEKPVESAHDGFSTSHFSEGMEWSSRVASQRFHRYCAGVLEGGRL